LKSHPQQNTPHPVVVVVVIVIVVIIIIIITVVSSRPISRSLFFARFLTFLVSHSTFFSFFLSVRVALDLLAAYQISCTDIISRSKKKKSQKKDTWMSS
jgi:hypothetical protein